MGRFANSRQLVRQTFAVLRQDHEMIWFPVLAGLTSLTVAASFIIPFAIFSGQRDSVVNDPVGIVLLFGYYLSLSFIATFFNTGLVACASERLRGGNPTFSYGLNAALVRVGKIFIWSLISATVGVILRVIQNKSGAFGKILAGLIGMAWSLLTFFIIPVMVLENLSVTGSIKRSGELFKLTWGENVVGSITLTLFFLPLMLIGIIPFVITSFYIFTSIFGEVQNLGAITIGWLISGAYLVILGILMSALNGIFNAALYRFATTKQPPPGFDPELIQSAFRPRGSRPIVSSGSSASFSG